MNFKNYLLHFLSGGASLDARWIVIRILTGVWCLACFFLVQIYCCTLTSHLTLPHSKPIVNSVYDIPNVRGLEITVDRNLGAEKLITESRISLKINWFKHFIVIFIPQEVNFGLIKHLGDMLRTNPKLRCNKTDVCLEKVKTGSHVYIQVRQMFRIEIIL